MSDGIHINARWNVKARAAYIKDDIRFDLNDAIEHHESKITFDFTPDSGEKFSRTYQIKKVQSKGKALSSYVLYENRWFLKVIPDLFIPARYRISLNRIMPVVIDSKKIPRVTYTDQRKCQISSLLIQIPENAGRFRPNLCVSGEVTLAMKGGETGAVHADSIYAQYTFRQHAGYEPIDVIAIKTLKTLESVVETDNPWFGFDVDQVLCELRTSDTGTDGSVQKARGPTEQCLKSTLLDLKEKFPRAKFVAISKGQDTHSKLNDIGLTDFFDAVYDSLGSFETKGIKFAEFIDEETKKTEQIQESVETAIEEQKTIAMPAEVVMIDDQLDNLHHVHKEFKKKEGIKVTAVHYLGAIDNTFEVAQGNLERAIEPHKQKIIEKENSLNHKKNELDANKDNAELNDEIKGLESDIDILNQMIANKKLFNDYGDKGQEYYFSKQLLLKIQEKEDEFVEKVRVMQQDDFQRVLVFNELATVVGRERHRGPQTQDDE